MTWMQSFGHGSDQRQRPWFLPFRSSKAFITFVVSFGVFTDQFVFAVIVPIMPFYLPKEVGVPDAAVQYWIAVLLAAYGAAAITASPFWGWYTDRTPSRQGPFQFGLLVLAGATIMIWLATSMVLQLVGRVFQGLAAAMLWITGLALIADTVGQKDVGQYMSYIAIAMMIGTLVGPLLGGVVFAEAGYNAVFEMILGLIGADSLLRFLIIERKAAMKWIPELALEDSTVTRLQGSTHDPHEEIEMMVASNSTEDPDTDDGRRALLSTHERSSLEENPDPATTRRRFRRPILLGLLSSGRLLSALWGSFVVGAIFSGLEAALPLQTQATFGWNSIGGGLIFLPITIPTFFGPLVGWFCDRYGPRLPTCGGFLLLCPSLALLGFVNRNTWGQKVLLCALLTLIGSCFTLTLDPLIAEIAYVVEYKAESDAERYGSTVKAYAQAFALFNMAYSVGNTVGPLWAGVAREAAGWGTMSWTLGLLAGVSAISSGLWCGGWISNQDARWGQKQRISASSP